KKDGKFQLAWEKPSARLIDASQAGLDFPPTYFDQSGKTKIALVSGTRLIIVDGELGTAHTIPLEFPVSTVTKRPVTPTAGAAYIDKDGGMFVIPGSDSNLHVLTSSAIGKNKMQVWTTDLQKNAVIVKTAPT